MIRFRIRWVAEGHSERSERLRHTVIPNEREESAFRIPTMLNKRYYLYIMASRSRTLYTGVSSDLVRRVYEHKNKLLGGFTSRYNIGRLVHFEEYTDPREAIAREKEIKGWRREKKVALIESANPTWDDLSEGWYEKADSSLRSE